MEREILAHGSVRSGCRTVPARLYKGTDGFPHVEYRGRGGAEERWIPAPDALGDTFTPDSPAKGSASLREAVRNTLIDPPNENRDAVEAVIALMAQAWDEGYVAGNAFGYEWAQDTYDGPAEDPTPNPYKEG